MTVYNEIHKLKQLGFNVSQIKRKVGVDRETIRKYLSMDYEEMSEWTSSLQSRTKKLSNYEDVILDWLTRHPDLSAAQIEDWLLEDYPSLTVGSSTIRLFVKDTRERFAIPKVKQPRQYEAVPEVAMGEQIQVDWGECEQETVKNGKVKLRFISFVLGHSRYKYVEWLDRPFTTKDTIRCHEQAFRYFGGMTKEIVYDQDNLIAVSENAGDLLLTREFEAYKQARGFQLYLCRAADPESKGKIERVVGYVKGNFAKNRVYDDLDDWNQRCRKWLDRTGNHKVHGTTKKRPDSVFLLEKAHLKPVSPFKHMDNPFDASIAVKVGKDNTIRYKGNRYSVPLGTYKSVGSNQVLLKISKKELIILSELNGEEIDRHDLSFEKGKLIKKTNHGRDRSKTIKKYKEAMIALFEDDSSATPYIEKVIETHKRYARDQFIVLEKAVKSFPDVSEAALQKCIDERLWSANDFRDVSKFLAVESQDTLTEETSKTQSIQPMPSVSSFSVSTRPLSEYTKLIGDGR
ncbi:IS21 family transposase [Alkalibacterium pelagium]|uniref:Transposase n=1 Tax=Alkalibacterium pelagium TaxID=426702 RepID=A0A1H7PVM7_9LACT|nr:IS21 family transposase [Alkalibacterium pelagium]SEL39626.1 Transposase [Alkalibacterium pelagium]